MSNSDKILTFHQLQVTETNVSWLKEKEKKIYQSM